MFWMYTKPMDIESDTIFVVHFSKAITGEHAIFLEISGV